MAPLDRGPYTAAISTTYGVVMDKPGRYVAADIKSFEAWRLCWTNDWNDIAKWCGGRVVTKVLEQSGTTYEAIVLGVPPFSNYVAIMGWWIIDIGGDFLVVSDKRFTETYREAPNDA